MYADINDVRSIKDFRGGSFSQYKIADVKTACIKELNQSNIKNSYYWIMDLVCSGHIKEAWEILIGFYANSVNPCVIGILGLNSVPINKVIHINRG